jgi:PAS domain S-box-containing protein
LTDSQNIPIEELKELQLLASVAKNSQNSILILDKLGNVEWVNSAFSSFYGYTLKEYNAQKESESTEYIQVLHNTDRNFFKNNKLLNFTRELYTKTGERKWVLSNITPLLDDNGNIRQFIVIETDITQQKELEEELIQREENTLTLTEHLESVKDYVEEQIESLNEQKNALEKAKEKSEEVLHKVLPYEVAIQLKKKGYATPRHYKKVTVIHINLRNFFDLSQTVPIEELVTELHENMVQFDNILERHYVEKIKTTGSIYLGAGGVPLRNRSNPIDVTLTAIEVRDVINAVNKARKEKGQEIFYAGIGIHTGKVIAGVVGKNKLSYDIWGDTVNISATIEHNADAGNIIISLSTYEEVKEYFKCRHYKKIVLSSAEELELYIVERIKPQYAADSEGKHPNAEFMQILSKL